MNAPLSSPSLSEPSQYFPAGQSASAAQQAAQPTSQPPAQPPAQTQRGGNDHDAVSPFLKDFNLVAEAAKRAQMAVLMRDMEAVGL